MYLNNKYHKKLCAECYMCCSEYLLFPRKRSGSLKARFLTKNKLWSNKINKFCASIGWQFIKIGHDFNDKVDKKLKLSINHFCPYTIILQWKKFRKIWTILGIENSLFDELSADGDIKFVNFIWLQRIFWQKPCFSGPRQLARQKANIH